MQRQLPNSIDAEQAILGAMLIYPNAVKATVEYGLEADQFFLDAHKRIYRIMRDVHEDNRSLDPTILITKLQDAQLLNSVGGSEYILELTDTATTSASIKHYVEIIQDKYKMRELISITEKI
ncbi:MAG TPA: DnaB-like helicase N-terminal domain-containing protein, partial [Erysipelotrichaceae bacterium]|nr:DnaB-like helicase N-terminal domain-containing protein [Erysipelotrichaceae bacterium]